jgi:(R,R)-butanediol dehydrogenase/meso-butanediol dehydrogenase/diacetyl reductase
MTKMKAARWHAAKDIRVEETSTPTPNDNQVKLR